MRAAVTSAPLFMTAPSARHSSRKGGEANVEGMTETTTTDRAAADAAPAHRPPRRPPLHRGGTLLTALLASSLAFAGCAAASADATSTGAGASDSTSQADASTASVTVEGAEVSSNSATDFDTRLSEYGATTEDATTASETISDAATAAQAFLETLSDEQRETVLYDFTDQSKTISWTNFPVTFVQRAGLDLTALTPEQREAAMAVMEALLSDEAYETVTGIIGGDEYLLDNSSSTEESLGHYYIAFFGDPSETGSWEIQFGGHHLGIKATLNGADDEITFAPTHLGVQPAIYTTEDGTDVQPFETIYETAFAFLDSLDESQLEQVYQGEQVQDFSCQPGGTCDLDTGTGLAGSELTDEQRQLLLDVIANWAALADEETNTAKLAEIEATLDDTYISWSGATEYDMSTGDGIGFLISGPDVYVGLAAQQGSAGADVDGVTTSGWGHVHTIYRDPTDDYGGSVEQASGGGMTGDPGGAPGGAPGGWTPPADAPTE